MHFRTIFFSVLAAAAFAQTPDRAPLADEWGYRPAEGATVSVNPPPLSWVLEKGATKHSVQLADNTKFDRATLIDNVPYTVYTHHAPLKAGKWHWRYRINDGPWSKTRTFVVPANAPVFPQPTMDTLRKRIPDHHPRLFVHRSDLPRLKAYAAGEGKQAWAKLIAHANAVAAAEPTAEPTVMGDSRNPETRDHWWSNRVQAIKALQEAEVLSFAWLMTGDKKYADPARRFTMALAKWNPDGPTRFSLNCEAAKPMLHRLARAYDWAYDLFSEDERTQIRAMLLRRAQDAWQSGEVRLGAGHLNQPYNSHGNRTWHKLAENAIATLGETPESEKFLEYAVTKFFGAYPAWSDDDGGWHEGLSYLSGYMVKTRWWMHLADQLGLKPFQNPFYARIGDYALYSAPPGSPDLGLGDLAFRPPGNGWAFLHYFTRASGNGHWAWWLDRWKVPEEGGEYVLDFIWSSLKPVQPKSPADLPTSKVFRGTGVAMLNTTLEDSAGNVQVRFKSSPMGRWSHGHDPHNSFTLNAYGVPLIVNNVYRDLYGSAFHKGWVWHSKSQNSVLVNGEGQKPRSADLGGRIAGWSFQDGLDFVSGDAAASYEGKLTRARRHVFFIKPDIVVLVDDLQAPVPSTFQFMLHGQQEFKVDGTRLTLDRGKAGVQVDYLAQQPLKSRQWTGYDPPPDYKYLESVKAARIPDQWHVETATADTASELTVLTVMHVFANGRAPEGAVRIKSAGEYEIGNATLKLDGRKSATVRRGGREWKIALPD